MTLRWQRHDQYTYCCTIHKLCWTVLGIKNQPEAKLKQTKTLPPLRCSFYVLFVCHFIINYCFYCDLSMLSAGMYLIMSRSLARVYPGGREKMPCVFVSMHSVLTLNSYPGQPPFSKILFLPLTRFSYVKYRQYLPLQNGKFNYFLDNFLTEISCLICHPHI